MVGNAIFQFLKDFSGFDVYGTVRFNLNNKKEKNIFYNFCANDLENLSQVLSKLKPDVVINCIGIIKQLNGKQNNSINQIKINSLFPHKLAFYVTKSGGRLIHISSDCVFSGFKGNYLESDLADATDLYGITKFLGELKYKNTITLRTSIIGHERQSNLSLVNWFLAQSEEVDGFKNAIFSGLTALELAKILLKLVIPRPDLHGLYHIASKPISKLDLLKILAKTYQKKIKINPVNLPIINRSLNGESFIKDTGYKAKSWKKMINEMYDFNNYLKEKENVYK